MSFIELKNVYKIFGSKPFEALAKVRSGVSKEELLHCFAHNLGICNLNLQIEEGEFFVVMGLSGSGKSTMVRHLNRLIDPTAGEILVNGVDIMSFSRAELMDYRRHTVSMVFQKFGLLPHRNIVDNVAYGLEIRGVASQLRRSLADEWIERVGLAGYESSYPRSLSGGMQQRVGLARALATGPKLLLMDEPFSALDPLIRREMQELLLVLQRDTKKSIVFITHDLDEALRLGDRIAILKDARLIQVGSPSDIVERPADAYVESFVSTLGARIGT
jgi:glycine betaine/proline transport system ATP-binding protein